MDAREAADFLRLSENAFNKLAPSLPRVRIYDRSGYRYLRSDLIEWLRERSGRDNPAETGRHLEAVGGIKKKRSAPPRGVKRLI